MMLIVELVPNRGVIIEEIHEEGSVGDAAGDTGADDPHVEAEAEPVDPEQEEYERNIRTMEEEADD